MIFRTKYFFLSKPQKKLKNQDVYFQNTKTKNVKMFIFRAEAIFKQLDSNGDGSLDEEEFCK